MPRKPPTACRYSGCPNLCDAGQTYCFEHHKERAAVYDRERGSAIQRGYGSEWQKYSRSFLQKNPFCVGCGQRATQVDHIIPAKPGNPLFWDPSNHEQMCNSCHSRKTASKDGGFGNKPKGEGGKNLYSSGR
jgi:5-methylcytosine-specific restriction protein A